MPSFEVFNRHKTHEMLLSLTPAAPEYSLKEVPQNRPRRLRSIHDAIVLFPRSHPASWWLRALRIQPHSAAEIRRTYWLESGLHIQRRPARISHSLRRQPARDAD